MGYLPNNTEASEKTANFLLDKALAEHNDEFIAKSYYVLGAVKYYDSRFYLSNQYYDKALSQSFVKKNYKLAQACHNNKGANYDLLNNMAEAIKEYNKALTLAEMQKDSLSIHETLINIALLDTKTKNYDAAIATNSKCLSYFTRQKDSANMALCHQNLSIIYKERQMLHKALQEAGIALSYHKKDNYVYGIVQAFFIIGEIYQAKSLIPKSTEQFLSALNYVDNADSNMEVMESYIYVNLAKNYLHMGNYTKARYYLTKAEILFSETGITENIDLYHFVNMEYFSRANDQKGYSRAQSDYITYLDNKEAKQSLDQYNELKALYGFKDREQKIVSQKKEIVSLNMQLYVAIAVVVVVLLLITMLLYYYRKMHTYAKSLYSSTIKDINKGSFSLVSGEHNKFIELYNSVVKLMEEEELYLQPGLTILDISNRLNTNDKYISKAINEYSQLNFNAFINKYRIDLAKKTIVENGAKTTLKIVAIRSGFNNPTTFYRQFKEITGLTPSRFMEISEQQIRSGVHQDIDK